MIPETLAALTAEQQAVPEPGVNLLAPHDQMTAILLVVAILALIVAKIWSDVE